MKSDPIVETENEYPQKSALRENIEAILVAIVIALFIRTFVVQAFKIPSGSMKQTLQIGDHILVNKFIYGLKIPYLSKTIISIKKPRRGDIVVFKYPVDPNKDFIKRVVGIPGDTVQIKNKRVFINAQPIEDPHAHYTSSPILKGKLSPRDNLAPITVPDGKVFVMGDNRDNSHDSRFWGFVDQRDILGKAFIIYWSWDIQKPLFSIDRLTSVRWGRLVDIIH